MSTKFPRFHLRSLLIFVACCAVGLAFARMVMPRHEEHEYTLEEVWAELTDENIVCWSDFDQALASFGLDALPKLIEGVEDERFHVRASCINALWYVARQSGHEAEAAIPALLNATEDKDPGIRKTAADALTLIDSERFRPQIESDDAP